MDRCDECHIKVGSLCFVQIQKTQPKQNSVLTSSISTIYIHPKALILLPNPPPGPDTGLPFPVPCPPCPTPKLACLVTSGLAISTVRIPAGTPCGTTRIIFFSSSLFSSRFRSFQPSSSPPRILPFRTGESEPRRTLSVGRRIGADCCGSGCCGGGGAEYLADCMLERARSKVLFAVSDHPRWTGGGFDFTGLGRR